MSNYIKEISYNGTLYEIKDESARLEIETLKDLYDFSNKIKLDLLITDTRNVICYNRKVENYSTEFIDIFLNKYPYAIEIYDDYRE